MKIIISSVIFLLFIFGISCTPEEPKPNNHNYSEEEQVLKDKLLGIWIELSPCDSCFTYRFTDDDSIITSSTEGSKIILPGAYTIVSNDSIEVIRCWEMGNRQNITKNKVVVISDDTILIEDLFPVDYDSYLDGFVDVRLNKID